jgi:hypothetical protein
MKTTISPSAALGLSRLNGIGSDADFVLAIGTPPSRSAFTRLAG